MAVPCCFQLLVGIVNSRNRSPCPLSGEARLNLPLFRSLTLISYAGAIASIAMGGYSFHIGFQVFWSANERRYDVFCENGSVAVRQLQRYEFDTPFRWGIYSLETQRQFEGFKKSGWWHGDNSWWERTGYSVQRRHRLCGFEMASGTYWPPFVWQHPTVPFSLVQIPSLALVLLFSLLPAARILLKLRSLRGNRKETTWSAGPEAGFAEVTGNRDHMKNSQQVSDACPSE